MTSTYIIAHGSKPIDRAEIIRIMGLREPFWNDTDQDFRATWANGLGQERSRMHSNWTGFDGIEQEDAIIAISMGPILDRTREHMVAADRAVIHLRLRLLDSVRRHEDGEQPIGLGVDVSDVRSLPDTVILPDHRWQALVPGNVGASRAGTSDAAS